MVLAMLPVMAATSYTLVLDPGHGGKDPGAVGKFSKEKDLNLSLALEVGKLINAQYPDVNVVYTRSTDVFIPLQERADIANKANADLFISIHTNSAESKVPSGVETFILGSDKMEKNLDVAMRENAVMKLEADYKTTYQGFDPNSIDSYIMFELMQNSYMDQSLQFATQVQNHFVGRLNREDRGVRQAAFWVLLKTACPSILFEMGFISNPDEEKYMNKAASKTQMAQAIVDAFGAYTHKQAIKKEVVKEPDLNEVMSEGVKELTNEGVKEPQTYYAVQVCASKTMLAPNDPKLQGKKCEYMQVGEWYKYYTAADKDRKKVEAAQKKLKKSFPDCWIIKVER
jgi:N-acetylmuramoyl-L-alanine amidase